MSDISPDEAKQQSQAAGLSGIAPTAALQASPAAMPYEPPAWMQSEQHTAEMSDISPSQPATCRITVRLPTANLTALDARANALNASRSDYLRTLIALPVTLDVTSIRHATPGTESLTRPLGPGLALMHSDGQTESLAVQAITDNMLESISNEVRAIGVNYNQSVRALNRILKNTATIVPSPRRSVPRSSNSTSASRNRTRQSMSASRPSPKMSRPCPPSRPST